MASTFDTCRVQPECSTPQVTSFVGVSDNGCDWTNASKDECAKITLDLNQEVARYSIMAVALGTTVDSDYLRFQLRQSRIRALDFAQSLKKRLVPTIRKKRLKLERCEELELLYRVFCATLEYLEGVIFNSRLVQIKFPLYSGCILIETGLSETTLPKKGLADAHCVSDLSPEERQRQAAEDIVSIESQIKELQEMVYEMNSSIALQPWDVEPDTDKITTDDATKDGSSSNSSVVEFGASSGNEDQRKIRCVSIVVIVVICVLIGGIVGILMGVLDY